MKFLLQDGELVIFMEDYATAVGFGASYEFRGPSLQLGKLNTMRLIYKVLKPFRK